MVIVIVQIPISPRGRSEAIEQALRSAPRYRELGANGLIRKHYLNGPDGGGGVYLWRSRADAQAWYTDTWWASMEERFGARPVLSWYENLVTVDNIIESIEVTQ